MPCLIGIWFLGQQAGSTQGTYPCPDSDIFDQSKEYACIPFRVPGANELFVHAGFEQDVGVVRYKMGKWPVTGHNPGGPGGAGCSMSESTQQGCKVDRMLSLDGHPAHTSSSCREDQALGPWNCLEPPFHSSALDPASCNFLAFFTYLSVFCRAALRRALQRNACCDMYRGPSPQGRQCGKRAAMLHGATRRSVAPHWTIAPRRWPHTFPVRGVLSQLSNSLARRPSLLGLVGWRASGSVQPRPAVLVGGGGGGCGPVIGLSRVGPEHGGTTSTPGLCRWFRQLGQGNAAPRRAVVRCEAAFAGVSRPAADKAAALQANLSSRLKLRVAPPPQPPLLLSNRRPSAHRRPLQPCCAATSASARSTCTGRVLRARRRQRTSASACFARRSRRASPSQPN
eukprot:366261-Chlamydomonas_euryale.AAC.9